MSKNILNFIETVFLDVDECQTSPCNYNAICNNTDGSYTCKCNSGYSGDGLTCTGKTTCVISIF